MAKVTCTKRVAGASGHRAPVADGKWDMATGKGGNPKEKLRNRPRIRTRIRIRSKVRIRIRTRIIGFRD